MPRPTNTVSASAAAGTAPAPGTTTKRRGFWNRRGDHLTSELEVVYAPSHLANPPDLKDYPDPKEGYLDHHGVYIKYDPKRREMDASLPKHGLAPEKPYERFIQWVTV
jgi:hypothetical protein